MVKNKKCLLPCAAAFMLLCAAAGLAVGASGVIVGDWTDKTSAAFRVLYYVRLPRVLCTLLCGAALGVAGAVLQTVLQNPLSSPNIIGVNAGAGLGAVVCMAVLPLQGALYVSAAAFLGACAAVAIVYFISRAAGSGKLSLVLSGVAVSSLLTAGIDAVTTFYPKVLPNVTQFKIGSAANVSMQTLMPLIFLVPLCIILVIVFKGQLRILSLGDDTAKSLGLCAGKWRFVFLSLSCALAGGAVSVMGLVGFVGLVVPHITRLLCQNDESFLPLSALVGAGFLTLCDLCARTVFAPYELPVGIILSVLGAPFFLYLLARRR